MPLDQRVLLVLPVHRDQPDQQVLLALLDHKVPKVLKVHRALAEKDLKDSKGPKDILELLERKVAKV